LNICTTEASGDSAGAVRAEGELDARCALGVDRAVPVTFRSIRLQFDLDSRASEQELDTLLVVTELSADRV
jgi:hypothetical protein